MSAPQDSPNELGELVAARPEIGAATIVAWQIYAGSLEERAELAELKALALHAALQNALKLAEQLTLRMGDAERQVAELRGVLKAAAAFIEGDGDNLGILDGCDGYFQWGKVYAPLRPRIAAALSEQIPEQKT